MRVDGKSQPWANTPIRLVILTPLNAANLLSFLRNSSKDISPHNASNLASPSANPSCKKSIRLGKDASQRNHWAAGTLRRASCDAQSSSPAATQKSGSPLGLANSRLVAVSICSRAGTLLGSWMLMRSIFCFRICICVRSEIRCSVFFRIELFSHR